MTPTISIIVPVYNRSKVLARAIESVLSQTYVAWEVIIVDDCSTDDTLSVARHYASDRIKILQNSANKGAAGSRNVGIMNSKGRYVAFLDSDDLYHPTFLSESLNELNSTSDEYGFSYCVVGDVDQVSAPKENIQAWRIPEKYQVYRKPYLYELHIGTASGILMKREVFNKIGYFDESMKAAEDTDFFIRVSEFYKGLPISKLMIYKDDSSENRLTSNYARIADAYDSILTKNQHEIEGSEVLTMRWYYKAMWLNFYSGRKSKARSYYMKLARAKAVNMKVRLVCLCGIIFSARTFISVHRGMNKLS